MKGDEVARRRFSNVSEAHAPLAQSVERFHGKEEVFGSNPEGGSASRLRREGGELASQFSPPARCGSEAEPEAA